MTALVFFKRSDTNLVLVARCECDGKALAEELSKRQAFTVDVVACLPTLGGYAGDVQATLTENHVMNGWFAVGVGEAIRAASWVVEAALNERPGAGLPMNVAIDTTCKVDDENCSQEAPNSVTDSTCKVVEQECSQEPPNSETDSTCKVVEENCSQEAPNSVTDSTCKFVEDECSQKAPRRNDGFEQECLEAHNAKEHKAHTVNETRSQGPNDEDSGEEMSEPSSKPSCNSLPQQKLQKRREASTTTHMEDITRASQCLEACPREQADTAKTIKTWLHEQFGKNVTATVLSNYEERVMRKGCGEANQRMFLNGQGQAMRLRAPTVPDPA